jgi:4-hydroxy-3-polyprenylbenzoate decarboxylase
MGIDATRKIAGEEVNGIEIAENVFASSPKDCIAWGSQSVVFPEFGSSRCAFVSVNKQNAGDGERAIEALWQRAPDGVADFVIAVNSEVDIHNWENVLFHWCANTDPGRDLHRSGWRIAFDATTKMPGDGRHGQPVRDYPPIIAMDGEVLQRIEARKAAFGLQ